MSNFFNDTFTAAAISVCYGETFFISSLAPVLSLRRHHLAFHPQSSFTVFSKNGYKPPGYESSSSPLSDGTVIKEYGACSGISWASDVFSNPREALSDHEASVEADLARFQV